MRGTTIGNPPRQRSVSATGEWIAPAVGLQESAVQALPSSTTGGAVGTQSSTPLHTLVSLQLVPAMTGACVGPPAGVQASAVQGLRSSHWLHAVGTALKCATAGFTTFGPAEVRCAQYH